MSMVLYRRAKSLGGTFAITFTLNERGSNLLVEYCDVFKSCYSKIQARQPFETVAFVLLPDHAHMVWTLPENDGDYSLRVRLIKHLFTRSLLKKGVDFKKRSKGERSCWQRRFWEHQVRNEYDLQRQVDYIHYNPVKHGYVKNVKDWPHSSFHRYVREGKLPLDWGDDFPDV
jgi:putative transposase